MSKVNHDCEKYYIELVNKTLLRAPAIEEI
jgi:hypothetical protein